ncbi:MAG: TetR/AcrR family transcriptional regulator [Actinomycetota bacterium]|nr:TetR/AcrR family transcriptional regulator [Actinomycetota bacterium]
MDAEQPGLAKSRPGRPPSQAARQLVLEAAYRIVMDEGLGRLTIDRVAAQTGVSKPTIYRNWANAQELAMAAFMAQPPVDVEIGAPLTARAAIADHLRTVIQTLATQRGRQITLMMASADTESELAKAFRSQVILKSREQCRVLIQQAVLDGEIDNQLEIETVLDMLYGPLFFRLLVGHQSLTPDLADQLIAAVFDGIAAS